MEIKIKQVTIDEVIAEVIKFLKDFSKHLTKDIAFHGEEKQIKEAIMLLEKYHEIEKGDYPANFPVVICRIESEIEEIRSREYNLEDDYRWRSLRAGIDILRTLPNEKQRVANHSW